IRSSIQIEGLPDAGERLLFDAWFAPVADPRRENLLQSPYVIGRQRHLVVRCRNRPELALDDVIRDRGTRDPTWERMRRIQLVAATREVLLLLDNFLPVFGPARIDQSAGLRAPDFHDSGIVRRVL